MSAWSAIWWILLRGIESGGYVYVSEPNKLVLWIEIYVATPFTFLLGLFLAWKTCKSSS